MNKAGIVGYGSYVPKYRIKTETIAEVWGTDPNSIKNGLKIHEKSLPAMDEDSVTISVQAAKNALARAKINSTDIGAIYIGSESHPYAVNPSSTIVAEALDLGNDYTAVDTQFACKAGSAAIQICAGLVKSEMAEYALAIGADTAQAGQGNALEYSAAAGGAAFIMGRNQSEFLAEMEHTVSFSSDTPDFWRRGLQSTPEHAGRFTGQPAYFKHVMGATNLLLEKSGYKPEDFTYAVFHQPNGKFPAVASKRLGFTKEQIAPGMVVTNVGNTYSGASMLGLAATLDVAKPGDKIMVTSYGSGAGSDSFVFNVTEKIIERRPLAKLTSDYIARKEYVSYSKYNKHMECIH